MIYCLQTKRSRDLVAKFSMGKFLNIMGVNGIKQNSRSEKMRGVSAEIDCKN